MTDTFDASELHVRVYGSPVTQGSKKAWVNPQTGRAQMREQTADKLNPWRQDVATAVARAIGEQTWAKPEHAVSVRLLFILNRPKSWPQLDTLPRKKPDVDKLTRAVFDALKSGGAYHDDGQVVSVRADKRFSTTQQPGVHIRVRDLGR